MTAVLLVLHGQPIHSKNLEAVEIACKKWDIRSINSNLWMLPFSALYKHSMSKQSTNGYIPILPMCPDVFSPF
jgi:hypothetical protein